MDSVLDYPTWRSLTNAFQSTTGSLAALASTVSESQSKYKNGEMMTGSFLENHDQPRFQSLTTDQAVSFIQSMSVPRLKHPFPIVGEERHDLALRSRWHSNFVLWLAPGIHQMRMVLKIY